MRAAFYREQGGSDVLQVGEVPTPEPGPGEVRVKLAVSGVNPTDWKSRSGATAGPPPFEFQVPNQDGAGVIDAVGPDVDGGRVGERVWVFLAARGNQWGTAAEYTVLPASQAVAFDASDELGASLGVPALTAHRCLHADGPFGSVLVAGGAGAVGHAAIELARFAGARVIATVSNEEKADLARAAGAHAVVNYREEDAIERIRELGPVDRVVEVALHQNLELDLAACAPHAAIVTYAATADDVAELPVRQLMAANLVLRGVLLYTVPADALAAAVRDVSEAVAAGALTTLPLHRFPLERAAEAHDAVEAGAVGKVLIDI
jgi:NADPH2:quinone reductase